VIVLGSVLVGEGAVHLGGILGEVNARHLGLEVSTVLRGAIKISCVYRFNFF
jgi:hypothetical protein